MVCRRSCKTGRARRRHSSLCETPGQRRRRTAVRLGLALRTRAADAPARRMRRRLPRVGAPLPRADRGGGATLRLGGGRSLRARDASLDEWEYHILRRRPMARRSCGCASRATTGAPRSPAEARFRGRRGALVGAAPRDASKPLLPRPRQPGRRRRRRRAGASGVWFSGDVRAAQSCACPPRGAAGPRAGQRGPAGRRWP